MLCTFLCLKDNQFNSIFKFWYIKSSPRNRQISQRVRNRLGTRLVILPRRGRNGNAINHLITTWVTVLLLPRAHVLSQYKLILSLQVPFFSFFSSYSSNFSSRSIHFCSVSSFFLFLFSSLFVLLFGSPFASSTPFFPSSLSSYSSSSKCSSLFIYPSLCSWVSSHSSFCALNPHMPTCLTVSLAIQLYIYYLTNNTNIL